MKSPLIALASFALVSCAPTFTPGEREPIAVINDKELKSTFEKEMGKLYEAGGTTPHATLVKQLSRKSCKLDLPAPGKRILSPSEVYRQGLDTTVLLGKLNRCRSKQCRKTHASIASGVIIHEDGVVLTNYHVVDSKAPRLLGMGAMTHDGKAFLVEEVLAADKKSDFAILKLKGASGLSAAPIYRDEPVGNPAIIISHPTGKFFTLSQGAVSRYHVRGDGTCVMNVTADYAKGSSGGPIFNHRGDLIGLVASTVSIPYRHAPLAVDEQSKALKLASPSTKAAKVGGKPLTIGISHQMTLKNTVPSRAILEVIEE
ncbi:MAG: serine protease [Akkermansiaceae bacterium]|nr:serine protease [Akkermansiaceae bacterium]